MLLQVGDWKITTPEDVLNASFYVTPEEPIAVRISRAGKPLDLKLTPGESPDGKGATPNPGQDLIGPGDQVGLKIGG